MTYGDSTIIRQSGYDPATGICWQFGNKGDGEIRCKCPVCSKGYGERTLAWFGRCRSGSRWFWAASPYFREGQVFGWADTEELAVEAAMTAIRGFRCQGLPILAQMKQTNASLTLKKLNEAKRRARPAPNTSDTRAVEYLYAHGDCWSEMPCDCEKLTSTARWNYHIQKFQILKKTKQRIYYSRQPLPFVERPESGVRDLTDRGTAFVNRQKLVQDGEIWSHKAGGWWEADCRLYLQPPKPPEHWWGGERGSPTAPETHAEIHRLKAEMAAAHPDRGGTSAAFIEARARYVAARRRARKGAAA